MCEHVICCEKCGKIINKSRWNKRFCSDKCRGSESARRWREKNPEYQKEYMITNGHKRKSYQKKYRKNKKLEFVKLYGERCVCCGDNRMEFLTLDHVNNDGNLLRGKNVTGTSKRDNLKEYNIAIAKHNPDKFQILCMNCNCGKAWYGECPCKNYL